MGQGNASTLTPDDAQAIAQLPGVQYVAAGSRTRAARSSPATMNWDTQVQGTDVDLPLIRSWPTSDGAFFTPQDVDDRVEGRRARQRSCAISCSAPTSIRSAR